MPTKLKIELIAIAVLTLIAGVQMQPALMPTAEQAYEQEMQQAREEYLNQKLAKNRRAIVEYEAIAEAANKFNKK
jgi:hypothetical protein